MIGALTNLYIIVVGDEMFGQVLHIGPQLRMLADLQRVAGVPRQQVLDLLVVDLEVADLGAVGRAGLLAGSHAGEQLPADARDQALVVLERLYMLHISWHRRIVQESFEPRSGTNA